MYTGARAAVSLHCCNVPSARRRLFIAARESKKESSASTTYLAARARSFLYYKCRKTALNLSALLSAGVAVAESRVYNTTRCREREREREILSRIVFLFEEQKSGVVRGFNRA